MIRLEERFPKMSAGSGVSPTIQRVGRDLLLGYEVAGDEQSAVVRFRGVRDWHYGYPNDEGLDAHPLFGSGLEFYEFHVGEVANHGERAWIGTFHDGTFTIYAEAAEVLVQQLSGDPREALESLGEEGDVQGLDD